MKSLIAIALVTGASLPVYAQPAPQSPSLAERTSAAAYVTSAASADKYETESSKIALGGAANPDVRNFAQMMINDHGQTSAQLMAAAKAASIGVPGGPLPDDIAMLKNLRGIDKSKMERLYVDQQIRAHEKALALHQGYAAQGDNPGLRSVAAAAVPVIQRHLEEIRRIQTAMGGPLPGHERH